MAAIAHGGIGLARTGAVAVAVLAIATAAAFAQRAMPDHGNGRYSLVPRGEEFLRLDSRTGEVSVCAWRGAGWACVGLPDERAAYEVEIGRLMQENERLKRQLSARERASRDTVKPDQGPVRAVSSPAAEPAKPSSSLKQEAPSEPAPAPVTAAAPETGGGPARVSEPASESVSKPTAAAKPAPAPKQPSRQPESSAPESQPDAGPPVKEQAQTDRRVETSAPPPQAPAPPRTEKGATERDHEEGALERALAVVESAWRNLVGMVRRSP